MFLTTDHFFVGSSVKSCLAKTTWSKRFVSELQGTHADSLRILEKRGVHKALLLHYLFHYSERTSLDEERAVRSGAALMREELGKTRKSMSELADRLQPVRATVSMAGFSPHELPTPEGLRSAVSKICDVEQFHKRMASRRGKGRRDDFLVWAHLVIKVHTGDPHWDDLANLLETAFGMSGRGQVWDKDTVRRIVERYEKSRPEQYWPMSELMKDHYANAPTPKPLRRPSSNRRRASVSRNPFIY
jgi:hypothetical protein